MSEDLGPALERAQRRLRRATAERSGAIVESFLAEHGEPTRGAYRHDLEAFCAELRSHRVDLLDARSEDVLAHVARLRDRELRPATIRRRLAAISGLYRHARNLGVSAADPSAGVPRPRDSPRPAPSSEGANRTREMAASAEALVRTASTLGARDQALVLLLVQAGLRLGETLALDVGDLVAAGEGALLRVRGAGGSSRELLLPPACADASWRLVAGRREGPLLITSGGRRLDRHHARRSIGRAGVRAGVSERTTPRSLRQAFIARALAAGAEAGTVAAAVGLGDGRSLRRYGAEPERAEATRTVAVRLADPP